MRSGSTALFGMYGTVPDVVSIDIANAILFLSFGVTWTGARVFDHRAPLPALLLAGPLLWLSVSHFPTFADNLDLRVLLSCGVITAYTWPTAYEFWCGRSEPMVSRWPAICGGAARLLFTPRLSHEGRGSPRRRALITLMPPLCTPSKAPSRDC